MASQPLQPPDLPAEGEDLSDDQWWALFDYLRLSRQVDTSQYGDAVEYVRRLREEEDPFAC